MDGLRRNPILVTAAAAVGSLVLVSFVLPVPPPVVEATGWWSGFLLLGLTALSASRRGPTT